MFPKIVVIEEIDKQYQLDLMDEDIGKFGVYNEGKITVCESLTLAKTLVRELEGE